MVLVEALLISTLLFACGYSSYFDIKKGIIPNKLILISFVPIIVLDVIYYTVYARIYFKTFAINFVLLALMSILMYAFNLWAAGDSKLLFLIVLSIPGRFLVTDNYSELAPSIFIIVFTFAIAFIYVIFESVYLTVKSKEKSSFKLNPKQLLQFLKQYYCCSVYLLTVNYSLLLLFPSFIESNSSLITFLNLFLAIIIFKYDFFFKKVAVIIVSIIAAVVIAVFYYKYSNSTPDLSTYIYLAFLILIRSYAEKFNYKVIKTSEVKPGMILSYSTILMFEPSRIKGLPRETTEDMRSRLTNEEAESIIRWQESKYGLDEITIVRKVPFAIFMSLGSLLYLLVRIGVL